MEPLLVAAMLADAGIASLAGRRVNWVARPKASGLPAVTLQVVSALRDYPFGNVNPIVSYRVQVSCWAVTYLGVAQLRDAVLAFANSLTGAPFPRPELVMEIDHFEAGETPTPGASALPDLYAKFIDLEVIFRPAA